MSGYQSFYTTADDTTAMSVFGALYYGSLLILVIFLIVMFVHFTIYPIVALTANDPGIIVVSGTSDRELAYKNNDATPSTVRNKHIPRTTLPDICNYTIGFDLQIAPIILSNIVPYPVVILYREALASNPTPPLPPVSGYASAVAGSLHSVYQNTNLIVWADGTTKNIQVSLITTDANNQTVETSLSKEITPVFTRPWIRLAIVVADSFIEVYVDGLLNSTLNTPNSLKQIHLTDFYPPVVPPDVGGITIANMSMWPRILTSKEIRRYEATPMSS